MDDIVEAASPAPPKRRLPAAALVASGLVAGLVLAGLTTATAQSGPTPAPSTTAAPDPAPMRGKPGKPGKHGPPGKHGFGLPGLGRGVLHGEFTAPDSDGDGYRRMAVQNGEATAVSATSLTVRSEDGFTRTYVVDGDTEVHSADEGIGDVSAGDQVRVLAVLDGDTATAIHVADVTERDRLRDKWGPRRPRPSASPS